jgi:membrane-bound lytic murein transglycosylase B
MGFVARTIAEANRRLPVALAALLFAVAPLADAEAKRPPTPAEWVAGFWPTAKAGGISRRVYDAALSTFTPDPDVIKKSETQAEFNTKIWDYLDMMVSEDRLTEGKAALVNYAGVLSKIEARYGVDRYVVVAIWGMESHYGAALSNPKLVHNTIRSLATLAYFGGRFGKFGRIQLVAALKIVQHGDISAAAMSGSWAGAMGQTQFIPTTYNVFAVDFDGDGTRNIWTSAADALASTANYLNKSGWQPDRTWGYEVELPKDFSARKTAGERSLKEWDKLGVARVGGKAFPRPGDRASLFMPAGPGGPVFLLLANFKVIKRYNNATSYALAVGHLADRLRGFGPFEAAWPEHEPPLTLVERLRVQTLLTARGFYSGDVDGDLGSGSREAVKNYQLKIGETPDGVASRALLQTLEAGR